MTIREILAKRDALRTEMRGLNDGANGGPLAEAAQTRWTALEGELSTLDGAERRQAAVDDLDRRAVGQPVAGSDPAFDRAAEGLGLMDVCRAQMGGTDAAAGRAREVSQEMERRSGRKAQGLFWDMGRSRVEQRALTTATTGSSIVGTDYRPELFIDRLRNTTRVRALGATVLSGLVGNVVIPRRKASMVAGWVAENSALNLSDPQFDGVTLTPKHCGLLTEFSRNMILQASPDVEQLARQDMALVLAEALDAAAVAGTGASNQPRGILATPGIGGVAMGANGGVLTYDALADLMGQVDDANATGGSMGFLTNTKVRRAAAKIKDTTGKPLGLPVVFQNAITAFSNIIPASGTKGTGTGLSSIIYANWSDLLIGLWSELDILVNPYESVSYAKGNVSVRAMMTVDIATRHVESFAAITDVAA